MILELLVVSACTSPTQAGCSQVTSAYLSTNAELAKTFENTQYRLQKMIGGNEWIVVVATPMYAMATGQSARFVVSKRTKLVVNVKQQFVGLEWNY